MQNNSVDHRPFHKIRMDWVQVAEHHPSSKYVTNRFLYRWGECKLPESVGCFDVIFHLESNQWCHHLRQLEHGTASIEFAWLNLAPHLARMHSIQIFVMDSIRFEIQRLHFQPHYHQICCCLLENQNQNQNINFSCSFIWFKFQYVPTTINGFHSGHSGCTMCVTWWCKRRWRTKTWFGGMIISLNVPKSQTLSSADLTKQLTCVACWHQQHR